MPTISQRLPRRALLLACLLILPLVSSCGRSLGYQPTHDSGPTDARATDAALPFSCEGWEADLGAKNLRDINRLGLGLSQAVVEGTLGAAMQPGAERVVPFHVDKVWYGPHFLDGFDLYVPMDEVESAGLGAEDSVVIGFRGNPYPTLDEHLGAPIWWHKAALFPSSTRPDYGRLVGYHAGRTPYIGVVRLVERTADEARFEVVETLHGVLPETFSSPWNGSVYPVPFPDPGPTEYLASLGSLTLYAGSQTYSGVVDDLREATPENRALVDGVLADPVIFWDPASAAGFAERYRVGWAFKVSPFVLSTAVLGLAEECCTGAGGTYVAHRILESLQGQTSLYQVVTGGHAYYGEERCEEPYLLAVHGLEACGDFDLDDFACDSSGVIEPDSSPSFTMPTRVLELAGTAAERQEVDSWLAASPALYRLHAADQPAPPPPLQPLAPLFPGDPRAPWSAPVLPEQAILAATHPALLTVEEVALRPSLRTAPGQPREYYEVTLATTFSMYRFDHLTLHRVKIAFHCGDPRLLQVGAEWIGALLMDGDPYVYDDTLGDLGRAFLIPGLLLPSSTHVRTIFEAFGAAQ